MKKVTIMAAASQFVPSLEALRKLGLLHIKHMRKPSADGITSIEHRIKILNRAADILKPVSAVESPQELSDEEAIALAKRAIALQEEKTHLLQHVQELEKELGWFGVWGDVSENVISQLKQEKVFIKLYLASRKEIKSVAKDKLIKLLGRHGGKMKVALVTRDDNDALQMEEIKIPERNRHSVEKKLSLTKNRLRCTELELEKTASRKRAIAQNRHLHGRRLEFFSARFGAMAQDGFYCLEGYCPSGKEGEIRQEAKKYGWGYFFRDPGNSDQPPTLIRQPRWVEIINPVFKLMGTIPGYKEFDISLWFLLFFSLFFALLVADAGYGCLFLAVTLFARARFKQIPRQAFFLVVTLSLATIVWGAASGTWFGVEKIGQLPGLNALVIERVNSFVDDNQFFMMKLSFIIGALHLTVAHAMVALRYVNSLCALAQAGWIAVIWSMFFVAQKFVLGRTLPAFTSSLLGAGILLIVLFSGSEKNILKRVLISAADLPLKVINYFADILSYLRLFAVGYVSVVVAQSFNDMAYQVGFSSIFTGLAAAFILFLGHALNIILGLMAVLVHGIRLNMLEFSGHLDMQWAGTEYAPFKE